MHAVVASASPSRASTRLKDCRTAFACTPLSPRETGAQPYGPRLNARNGQDLVRPRIAGQASTDLGLAVYIDHEQGSLTVNVAYGPPENDDSLLRQRIHEGRVFVKTGLFPPAA